MKKLLSTILIMAVIAIPANAKTPAKHHKAKSGPTLTQQVAAMKLTIAQLSNRLAQTNSVALYARTTAENAANVVVCIAGGKWIAVNDDNFVVGSDGTEPTAFIVPIFSPGCMK